MIQILLDGMPVIPRDNVAIKLTVENVIFTKSASYTYEVELPLSIEQNRRVFGVMERMDVDKEKIMLSAVMIVDGITVLNGSAHITQVTETSVKVQLLGAAASYNYRNKLDSLYIDKLDLGDWYMTTWPDGSYKISSWHYYEEDTKFKGTSSRVFERAEYNAPGETGLGIIHNLFSGDYPWVAFPVINSSAGLLCNCYGYRFTNANRNAVKMFFNGYAGERGIEGQRSTLVITGAVQPYLWIMAEKIAQATGLELKRENNALFTNDFLKKIFIVNANNYIECNKCLPHWSVNEWWQQIENTFGLVTMIDYASNTMSLVERRVHYSEIAQTYFVNEVVDEYTTDVDDENLADISVSNVGYADHDAGPEDILSEYIHAIAVVNRDFDDVAALMTWVKSQSSSSLTERKNFIFECKDGRHYILKNDKGVTEVDMFRPRIKNPEKEDIEVELKFVPAQFVESECQIFPPDGNRHPGANPVDDPDHACGAFAVRVLEVPGLSDLEWYKAKNIDSQDIEEIISGEKDEGDVENEDMPDVIYIAMANLQMENHQETVNINTGTTFTNDFSYPRPLLRERTVTDASGAVTREDSPYSLSLIPIDGQINIASQTLAQNVQLKAKERYCISFVADRIPDVGSIFMIRHKRFVCEKIEASISSKGLDRMLTGYFYRLEL